MRQVNERCRLLEEHKYWNEFEPNRHQFFKVMIPDFEQRLRVPKKFVKNFKGSLVNPISLKGPSGDTWSVQAVRRADEVFFQNGWGKFVRDNGVKVRDFLVFHYAGDSSFNVLIFDDSCCEREGSYFVNKHGISCSVKGCVMERNEEEEVPSDSDSEHCMTKKGPPEVIVLDDDDEDTMQQVKAKPASSSVRHQEPGKDSKVQGMKPPTIKGSWKDDRQKWCPKPVAANSKHQKPKEIRIEGVTIKEDRMQRDSRCPEVESIMSKLKQSLGVNSTMRTSVPHQLMDSDEEDTVPKPATSKPADSGVLGIKPVGYWREGMQDKQKWIQGMQDGNGKLRRESKCSKVPSIMSKHKESVELKAKAKGRKRTIQDAAETSSTNAEASGTKPVVKLERKPKIRYSYVPKYQP